MLHARIVLFSTMTFPLLLLPGQVFAFDIWPDTGQKKCYDNVQEISCSNTGQDAKYHALPRLYTKLDANGNDLPETAQNHAMVRDELTGLIWEIKTVGNLATTYTWDDAKIYASGLSLGNYQDWRLPTVKELASLVDAGKTNPAIDTSIFIGTKENQKNYFWSSTPDDLNNTLAWFVNFRLGNVYRNIEGTTKNGRLLVRAVRAGRDSFTGNRFSSSGGTVTDNTTGLIWQQNALSDIRTWDEALTYCEGLTLNGQSDWRLPDRNELQTLIDYNRNSPATAPIFPGDDFPDPAVSPSYYWSSSANNRLPPNGENRHAWYVGFYNGQVYSKDITGVDFTAGGIFARAVRGNINAPTSSLQVIVDGKGIVSSEDSGIENCTETCTATVHYGDTLTATPAPGSKFVGWSGIGCIGTTNTCTVVAREGVTNQVTAKFYSFPWETFIPAVTGQKNHK